MSASSNRRIPVIVIFACLVLGLGVPFALFGLYNIEVHRRAAPPAEARAITESAEAEVRQFCGACHAYPSPESFPRDAWDKEIDMGFRFARNSGAANDLPDQAGVKKYYDKRAPERLTFVSPPPLSLSPFVRFERKAIRFPTTDQRVIVTSVAAAGPQQELDELIVCDARSNQVMLLNLRSPVPVWKKLADLPFPARATIVDLDGDNIRDVLVANLGVFLPSDELKGSVAWLRGRPDGSFAVQMLAENTGRVADVKPIDFNGDGKLDLIVAVFGWRATGELLLLENLSTDASNPVFETHILDERHGATEIAVADLNGDKRPDFVCLFSQEHETVVAFLNDGAGAFRQETIFRAPHPAYGCCSIDLADLDGDGDLDLVLANGDILDPPYLLKPYHGVRWLENTGSYPYVAHAIGELYGVLSARIADLDGDGDQDIAAVSYLPASEFPQRSDQRLAAVVLYEQTTTGKFRPHVLETGQCDNLCCVVGRFHPDAHPSLIVGHGDFLNNSRPLDAIRVWRNVGKHK